MLGDVVAAIKILLDFASGSKSPEKRRERMAKQIMKIRSILEDILTNGYEILDGIERRDKQGSNHYAARYGVLLDQQESLNKLQEVLFDSELPGFLDLHLSRFSRFRIYHILDDKFNIVNFYLSQFTGDVDLNTYQISQQPVGDYGDYEVLPTTENLYSRDTYVGLKATPPEISYARDQLRELSELNEQLKDLLLSKFKLEDTI